MRICRITTVPFIFLHHLNSQIRATISAGHEVYLVSSPTSGFANAIKDDLQFDGAHFQAIEIPRNISLCADLHALILLYLFFQKNRFDVVHSVTSKAGLLCAIAALLARVPIRMHTFISQPWAGLTGWVRRISKACDWLIVRLNTQCYADSESQRAFLISEKVADSGHIKTLGAGSIAGVDLVRFDIARFEKHRTKIELGIPTDAQIIVFIGRINREKGIVELAAAFELLRSKGLQNIFLLIIGPFESASHALPETTKESLEHNECIRVVGYTDVPEKYLAAAELFCLPSYREGFGSVVIEAAAMGVPTVATRVVGLVDAVVEDKTGLLVPHKNAGALADALALLLSNSVLRHELGSAAQVRARTFFGCDAVNRLVLNEYETYFSATCR